MSNTEESGAGMADTDLNSTRTDGTNVPGQDVEDGEESAAAQGSGDDARRGNLDGSSPVAEPRDRSLDQAGGNGSFEDASEQPADAPESDASDVGDSGQDNGLNS